MSLNVNMEESVEQVYARLDEESKEGLLKIFIRQEGEKKIREVLKNYKDINKYQVAGFANDLFERLVKKVFTINARIQFANSVTPANKPAVAKAKV